MSEFLNDLNGTIQRRAVEHGNYTMSELLLAGIYEELVAARLGRETSAALQAAADTLTVDDIPLPPKRGPGRPRKAQQ